MITRETRRALARVALLALTMTHGNALAQDTFRFVYLQRADDPYYEPHRAYTGLSFRDRHRPINGARTAEREGRILGRLMNLRFELEEHTLDADEDPLAALAALRRSLAPAVFLLDLPLADLDGLEAALSRDDLIFFNIRHADDRLRGNGCATGLFHTLPSRAMLMDALAQFLLTKHWRDVLILSGESVEDRALRDAFAESAKKFRLNIVDTRSFVLSADPRNRDQNNIALLTGGRGYDVVFLADSLGEFGRYVPYNVKQARPVIGTEGLLAGAWHWTWERHGAPQLNQRFDRIAKRTMRSTDFAAWAAVRSTIEAVVRTKSTDVVEIRAFLTSGALTFDAYKGVPASFRPWDHQLRQPILLHTANAVIARAPFEGFLHEKNNLDTLGVDRHRSECRM